MKIIQTDNALKPGGHYAQAVKASDFLFISGQLSFDPETGKFSPGSLEHEARQTLENIRLIVEKAGAGLGAVCQVRVYITDIADWPAFNKVYADFFGDHKPARAVVPVKELHFGARVEIEAVAYLGEG